VARPRLGFALILKFFEIEARFPRHASELPPAAVAYVARQVGVDPTELAGYEWVGSTAQYHRSQIRRALGFRRFSEDDPPPRRWRRRAGCSARGSCRFRRGAR